MAHIRHLVPVAGFLLTLGLLTPTPAHAGDAPTPEERTRIEAKLRDMGFERWDEIERDDGGREWEVDDAHVADGRKFDLRLAADDLRELSREQD